MDDGRRGRGTGVAREVVIEAAFDGRLDGYLGAPIQSLYLEYLYAIGGDVRAGSGSPPRARPAYIRVTDLVQPLLADVRILGPPGSRWLLKVNHGGSSLEAAVVGSHVRNLLLRGGLLGLLALSIGLVIFKPRILSWTG